MKNTLKTFVALAFFAPALAFAQTGTATTTTSTSTTVTATNTQAICISAALDKRENALISGHDAFNTAIKTALTNRLTSLKDAWSQTDKKVRQTKRQAAYKAFRSETQAAHTNMKTIRSSAWRTFDTEMRACGVRGHGEAAQSVSIPTTSL